MSTSCQHPVNIPPLQSTFVNVNIKGMLTKVDTLQNIDFQAVGRCFLGQKKFVNMAFKLLKTRFFTFWAKISPSVFLLNKHSVFNTMQQHTILARLNISTNVNERTHIELLLDGDPAHLGPDGLPNQQGAATITTVLIAALSAHIYATDQRGYKTRTDHLEYVFEKLKESEQLVTGIIVETT